MVHTVFLEISSDSFSRCDSVPLSLAWFLWVVNLSLKYANSKFKIHRKSTEEGVVRSHVIWFFIPIFYRGATHLDSTPSAPSSSHWEALVTKQGPTAWHNRSQNYVTGFWEKKRLLLLSWFTWDRRHHWNLSPGSGVWQVLRVRETRWHEVLLEEQDLEGFGSCPIMV